MYPEKIAQETAKVLQSYLTYQAVRTIIAQLSETNPTQAIWLSQYSSTNKIQDGEVYLNELMSEDKEMVLRIMTVREHLAETVLDFLPEWYVKGLVRGIWNTVGNYWNALLNLNPLHRHRRTQKLSIQKQTIQRTPTNLGKRENL